MRYVYPFAKLPISAPRLRDLSDAASRLHDRLRQIDPSGLTMTAYWQRYLKSYQKNLASSLTKCVYLIAHLVPDHWQAGGGCVLVDYGGGLGFLSLLAQQAGVAEPLYVDYNPEPAEAAQAVAVAVGLEIGEAIVGDETALLAHMQTRDCERVAIASSNVIEHIYDLDRFFGCLRRLPVPRLRIGMATTVNAVNRRIRNRYKRIHLKYELRGRCGKHGRTPVAAILDTRREIVRQAAPNLPPEKVELLALRTRGYRRDDIERFVAEYVEAETVPPSIGHPTNTCWPDTGNWCDRLLDPYEVVALLDGHGFTSRMRTGYFSLKQEGAVQNGTRLALNLFCRVFKSRALAFAPFYMIEGIRNLDKRSARTLDESAANRGPSELATSEGNRRYDVDQDPKRQQGKTGIPHQRFGLR